VVPAAPSTSAPTHEDTGGPGIAGLGDSPDVAALSRSVSAPSHQHLGRALAWAISPSTSQPPPPAATGATSTPPSSLEAALLVAQRGARGPPSARI
jgi:hypothetical protein